MNVLKTAKGNEIPLHDLKIETFINRSTVLYGPSGTGKTIIAKYLMSKMEPHMTAVLSVLPSEPSNQDFEGIIDSPVVHYKIQQIDPKTGLTKKTNEANPGLDLNAVWERNEMMSSIYTKANDVDILEELYCLIPQNKCTKINKHLGRIKRKYIRQHEKIHEKYYNTKGELEEREVKLLEARNTLLIKIYKQMIIPFYKYLWMRELTQQQRFSLKNIKLNPQILLIFDDCAALLKKFMKQEILGKLFYQNRHVKITCLFTFQDDTNLDASLRKNAFASIFTTPNVATVHFGRTESGGYTKEDSAYAKDISKSVFVGTQKLLYLREDPKRFYYFSVTKIKRSRFGSKIFLEYLDLVKQKTAVIDKSNRYFDHFN